MFRKNIYSRRLPDRSVPQSFLRTAILVDFEWTVENNFNPPKSFKNLGFTSINAVDEHGCLKVYLAVTRKASPSTFPKD
jgi:hypothetical protein